MPNTSFSARLRRAGTLSAALVALLALASAASAQSNFENPADGKPQSGIGMFSGWVCNADTVTIEVDGTTIIQAAYGTPRGDTEAICGDQNNGFGVLWNFNLFGDGEHTAVAKANGVAFGTHTFTVTKPTAATFATGLAGSYTVAFPPGKLVDLVWQQGTQNFTIAPFDHESAASTGSGAASPAATLGTFENPDRDSFVSGVIVFSGWLCDADTVEIVVDETTRITPAYGTARGDTEELCGDIDNGFGVLWNANLFGNGEHTAELIVDGVSFATRTFTVTVPTDQPFAPGLSATFRLPEFPDDDTDVVVEWQTGLQSFMIASKQPTAGPTPTPGPTATPGPTGTPGPSGTPGPTSTPGPTGGPGPTATPGPTTTATIAPSPTPTPSGEFCGNGIVDGIDEECDGLDGLDPELTTCYFLFSFNDNCSGEVGCTSDCRYDGSACDCPCDLDEDCDLFFDEIDCTPTYCSEACANPDDIEDCECTIDQGACIAGECVTTPVDPAVLPDLCFGVVDEDPEDPRCDYCIE